jgi:hypothetical protein
MSNPEDNPSDNSGNYPKGGRRKQPAVPPGQAVTDWGGKVVTKPEAERKDASAEREQILNAAHFSLKKHEQKYLSTITKEFSENAEGASRFLMGAHLLAIGRLHAEGNEDNSNLDLMTTAGAGKAYFEQFVETAKAEKVEDFLRNNNIRTFGGLPSKPKLFRKGGIIRRDGHERHEFTDDQSAVRRRIFHKMMLGVNAGEQSEIRNVIESDSAKKTFDASFLQGLPDETDPDLKYKPHGKETLEAVKSTIRSPEFGNSTNQAATEEMIQLSILTYLSQQETLPDKKTYDMLSMLDPNFEQKFMLMREHYQINQRICEVFKSSEVTKTGESGEQREVMLDVDGNGIINLESDSPLNKKLREELRTIENLSYDDLFEKGFLPLDRKKDSDETKDKPWLMIQPEETEEIKYQLIQQAYSPYRKLLSKGSIVFKNGESRIVLPNTLALEKCMMVNQPLAAGSASYFFRSKEYKEKRSTCQESILKVMKGQRLERVARHLKIHGPTYIAIWQRGMMIKQMTERNYAKAYEAAHANIHRDLSALGNI